MHALHADLSPGGQRLSPALSGQGFGQLGQRSLSRSISVAIDEESSVAQDDIVRVFDEELLRITQFYHSKARN